MIMAGGKGERLMPLTEHRSKPAVPFAAKYRIVDFVLSNFLNSGIRSMYVLVQYRSQSLIEHLRRAWRIGDRLAKEFVSVVPPQMRARDGWYEGTADAVYQNMNLIRDFGPDLIAVFGADHIYRMDIGQMVHFHLEHHADVTVAARPVPVEAARGFGIIEVTEEPSSGTPRIVGFQEKPAQPKPMPHDPNHAFSSMGNYLFGASVLQDILERDAMTAGFHDFGRDILPRIIHSHRVLAYNFCDNEIPGLKPYEERGYWRDVGTLDAYWQANMDILGHEPVFDLCNAQWPIITDTYDAPPSSFVRSHIDRSVVGQGTRIHEAEVSRSVIGRDVMIEQGASLDECIILDGATIGAKARLRRVIVDRFNVLPDGATIGSETAADREHYAVSPSGVVVLGQGRIGDRSSLYRHPALH